MAKTKKVSTAGRFGVRYGKGVRDRIIEIEKVQKVKHICPQCFKKTLKRISPGIWYCKKCGLKFAGKAYEPGI
ncbi:MAG: 50S ribosomal protein L37ae [Candidatus Aenigmatarchaeota archaeon]